MSKKAKFVLGVTAFFTVVFFIFPISVNCFLNKSLPSIDAIVFVVYLAVIISAGVSIAYDTGHADCKDEFADCAGYVDGDDEKEQENQ